MFVFRQLMITSLVAISVSTGCCLTKSCGIPGTCQDGACGIGGTTCRDAGLAVSCADGCSAGGCAHGCARPGSLLGLHCIGKLFQMSCYGLGCGSGCGEVYWHDWISDPPRPDPCDTCGNWTGVVATNSCDGCADPELYSQPILESSYVGRTFHTPGTRLCSGLSCVTSWVHRLGRGLLPHYGGCATCAMGSTAQYGGCATCAAGSTAQYEGCATCATGSCGGSFSVGSGVPLDVTAQQVRPTHRRPPHPVVAEWVR